MDEAVKRPTLAALDRLGVFGDDETELRRLRRTIVAQAAEIGELRAEIEELEAENKRLRAAPAVEAV